MKDYQLYFLESVKNGDVKKVKKLLNKGFSRDIITYEDETALHIAAKGNNVEMVQMLLNYGFDVNARTKNGSTPLIYAAKNGRFDICKKLLEHGADISLKTYLGKSALDYARLCLKIEMELHNEDKDYATEEEMKDKLYNCYFTIRLLKNEMKNKQIEVNNGGEIIL